MVSDIFVFMLCKGRKINVLYFVSVQFKAKLLMFWFCFCFFKLGYKKIEKKNSKNGVEVLRWSTIMGRLLLLYREALTKALTPPPAGVKL